MNTENYKDRAMQVLEIAKVIWNIAWGFISYLTLALQLFWDEYGETIQVGLVRFVFATVDFTGEVLLLGRKSRVHFDRWLTQRMDSAFFQLIDVQ
jgi:hypothetical protein